MRCPRVYSAGLLLALLPVGCKFVDDYKAIALVETCGHVDGGFGVGNPCESLGVCGPGKIECAGPLTVRCSSGPGGSESRATAEVCDGKDNNCNGEVDEGCPCMGGASQACGVTLGECSSGTQQCDAGVWGPCSGSGPKTEICDGLDNNCNGEVDEGCPCMGGASQACGMTLGECLAGTQRCDAGVWGPCSEPGPTKEICDGQDNNCNGEIDEGFDVGLTCALPGGCIGRRACSTDHNSTICRLDESLYDGGTCSATVTTCTEGQTRPCGSGMGDCADAGQTCINGEWGTCSPAPRVEECDGQDNNCNGETDEGFDIGSDCTLPNGCIGHRECTIDHTSTTCQLDDSLYGDAGCSAVGICSDGQTRSCGTGLGACTNAKQTCENGEWGTCSPAPSVELCDKEDNNCNGEIDEEFDIGSDCTLPNGCIGHRECSDDHNSAICRLDQSLYDGGTCSSTAAPCTEGQTRKCGSGMGDCANASQTCANGEWGACSPAPSVEACDGKDNNCNGEVDEGCPCMGGASQACGVTLGECLAGTQQCDAGVWGPCSGSGPKTEICDGLDNNCNGEIDEGCPCAGGALQACGVDLGTCTSGTQRCDGGVWSHCSGIGPTVEICDGQDNNCNGEVDEDFQVGVDCVLAGGALGHTACSNDGQGITCVRAPEVCSPLEIHANADILNSNTGALCLAQPDGSLAMQYDGIHSAASLECTFSIGAEDINTFAEGHESRGLLKVQFCVDPVVGGAAGSPGDLFIRFDSSAASAKVSLISASEVLAVDPTQGASCFTRYVGGPPTGGGVVDAGSSLPRLSLVAEGATGAYTVRLFSVEYLPPSCRCASDESCTGSQYPVCNQIADSLCSDAPTKGCGLMCSMGTPDDCNGLVGRFSDGWHDPSSSAIRSEFMRFAPALGCPLSHHGPYYAHELFGVEIQDFYQQETDLKLSGVDDHRDPRDRGFSAIVVDHQSNPVSAHLLRGGLWDVYLCWLDGPRLFVGPTYLGEPTSDMSLVVIQEPRCEPSDICERQTFEHGELTQEATAGSKVKIKLLGGTDASVSTMCSEISACVECTN